MCNINNCYECKHFRLKEVSEGEYFGWCSLCNECIDDVKECVNKVINKDE